MKEKQTIPSVQVPVTMELQQQQQPNDNINVVDENNTVRRSAGTTMTVPSGRGSTGSSGTAKTIDEDDDDENDFPQSETMLTTESSSSATSSSNNSMMIPMPKCTDSSYLKAIPEDRSDDGVSSIVGDFSGIVLSSNVHKARSTTSSTNAMMFPDEDDDDLLSDTGIGGGIARTTTASNVRSKTKSLSPSKAILIHDTDTVQDGSEGDGGQSTIGVNHRNNESVHKKSSRIPVPPPQGSNSFGRSYQQELRKKFWSKFWSKRMLFLLVLGAILVIGVVAAIVSVVVLNDSSDNATTVSDPDDNTNDSKNDTTDDDGGGIGSNDTSIQTSSPSDETILAEKLMDAYIQFFATNIMNSNETESFLYNVFNDTTSSQYKARNWLLSEDELFVNTIEEGINRFQQRFGLVVLYYQLNGPYWTSMMRSDETDEPIPIDFLQPSLHECNWTGITCSPATIDGDNDNSTDSSSSDNSTIPYRNPISDLVKVEEEDHSNQEDDGLRFRRLRRRQQELLDELKFTQSNWSNSGRIMQVDEDNSTSSTTTVIATERVYRIQMKHSNLTGNIPFEIAAIQTLTELDLSENDVTGTIPNAIFDVLKNIQILDLSNNDITGTIPSILWSLTNLNQLYLNHNSFTGSISSRYTHSTSLRHVWIQENELTGSIPTWFTNLDKLKVWISNQNQLNGTIPRPVPKNIEYIDLSNNDHTGSIPDSLWSQPNWTPYLSHVYLNHNQLSGSLPNSYEQATNATSSSPTTLVPVGSNTLKYVWLQNNLLTGTIPIQFGQDWYTLRELRIGNNNVTGTLGPTITSTTTTTSVCQEVWSNVTVLIADCFERYVNQPPPVVCDCCTYCTTTPRR